MFTVNSNEASATGMSPFYIERGREPMLPLDRNRAMMTQETTREDTQQFLERMWNIEERVDEALRNAKEAAALRYDRDRGREATTYEPGDKVWLSTKGITMPWDKERQSDKLRARYYGPFPVIRQTSPVTYELDLPKASNIHPIMHVSLLKPYKTLAKNRAPPLPKADEQNEYEIETILAHRKTKGGQMRYLVKWKGYTFEESTWEPEENFKRQTIDLYNRRRKEDKEEESDSDDEHLNVMDVSAAKSKTATAGSTGMDVDDPQPKNAPREDPIAAS